MTTKALALFCIQLLAIQNLGAWGVRGHTLANLAAVEAIPADGRRGGRGSMYINLIDLINKKTSAAALASARPAARSLSWTGLVKPIATVQYVAVSSRAGSCSIART